MARGNSKLGRGRGKNAPEESGPEQSAWQPEAPGRSRPRARRATSCPASRSRPPHRRFPSQRTVEPLGPGWGIGRLRLSRPPASSRAVRHPGLADPAFCNWSGAEPATAPLQAVPAGAGGSADPLDALQQYAGLPVGAFPGAAPAPDPAQLYQPGQASPRAVTRRRPPTASALRRPGTAASATARPRTASTRSAGSTCTAASRTQGASPTARTAPRSGCRPRPRRPSRPTARPPAASPTAASSPADYPDSEPFDGIPSNAATFAPQGYGRSRRLRRSPSAARPRAAGRDPADRRLPRPSAPGTASGPASPAACPACSPATTTTAAAAVDVVARRPPGKRRVAAEPTAIGSTPGRPRAPTRLRTSTAPPAPAASSRSSEPSRFSAPPATSATASSPAPTQAVSAPVVPAQAGRRRPKYALPNSLANLTQITPAQAKALTASYTTLAAKNLPTLPPPPTVSGLPPAERRGAATVNVVVYKAGSPRHLRGPGRLAQPPEPRQRVDRRRPGGPRCGGRTDALRLAARRREHGLVRVELHQGRRLPLDQRHRRTRPSPRSTPASCAPSRSAEPPTRGHAGPLTWGR